jgi:hypothetical protein
MSSKASEKESIAQSIRYLDRDTWSKIEDALIGIIADRNAKIPLLLTREEYVLHQADKLPDGSPQETLQKSRDKAVEDYDDANDGIHNALAVLFRNCPDARAVLHKYRAGRTDVTSSIDGQDVTNFQLIADGRAAW